MIDHARLMELPRCSKLFFDGGLGFYNGVQRSLYSRLQRFSTLMG
ncbi:uncharacterized protein G2W53_021630 [Senna tora]|uniref:Uncharacterized protein n=1 Tax=Senna tora TaxID=362788 RepID=A0A834TM39_9FABA|nr:uncharacterized protein G2W53_021630 [Senna tora]